MLFCYQEANQQERWARGLIVLSTGWPRPVPYGVKCIPSLHPRAAVNWIDPEIAPRNLAAPLSFEQSDPHSHRAAGIRVYPAGREVYEPLTRI